MLQGTVYRRFHTACLAIQQFFDRSIRKQHFDDVFVWVEQATRTVCRGGCFFVTGKQGGFG